MQVIFTFLRLSVIERKDIVGFVFVQTHMCSSDCDPLAMFPFKVKKRKSCLYLMNVQRMFWTIATYRVGTAKQYSPKNRRNGGH